MKPGAPRAGTPFPQGRSRSKTEGMQISGPVAPVLFAAGPSLVWYRALYRNRIFLAYAGDRISHARFCSDHFDSRRFTRATTPRQYVYCMCGNLYERLRF